MKLLKKAEQKASQFSIDFCFQIYFVASVALYTHLTDCNCYLWEANCCFNDTRLMQTPHHYGQFALSLRKGSS